MRHKRPVVERFWKYVKAGTADECWLWQGWTRSGGRYGAISVKGKAMAAHRLSWLLHKSQIPKGCCVLHRCDNSLCVNPNHLFLGTQTDNIRDMYAKGRAAPVCGEDNGNAKLTERDVLEIRRRRKAGESGVALAEEFGVTNPQIYQIALGRAWSHMRAEFEEEL